MLDNIVTMFAWLGRFRKKTGAQKSFGQKFDDTTVRVDVHEFAPGIIEYLSMNALAQLALYEAATQAVVQAPGLAAKSAIAEVAAAALEKHKIFTAELKRRGVVAAETMAAFVPRLELFRARVAVTDWHQQVLTVLLVGGIIEEFMASLGSGLKDNYKKTAIEVLQEHSGQQALQELLAQQIAQNPKVANMLALWGRRLVGDTLLLAQDVLRMSEHRKFMHEEMEPIFTALTGGHMQRMDSLGLTA